MPVVFLVLFGLFLTGYLFPLCFDLCALAVILHWQNLVEDHLCLGNSPECEPARELSKREFSLAPSNSSTESFIAVWKTANWPKTTKEREEKHKSVVPHGVRVPVFHRGACSVIKMALTKLWRDGDVVGAALSGGVVQRKVGRQHHPFRSSILSSTWSFGGKTGSA